MYGHGSARHELIIPARLPGWGPLPVLAGQCQLTPAPREGDAVDRRVKSAEETSPHVKYLFRLRFGTERACLVEDAVFVAPQ
jgi:hypothetical protein